MIILIVLVLVALVTLYYYGTKNHDYWKVRGVKYLKPYPLLGSYWPMYLVQKSMSQLAVDAYWAFPEEKIVGLLRGSRPDLVIRDPEIMKRILNTDFGAFYPRGFLSDRSVIEPMMSNLFFADGDLWRLLRQRMTPAFTSGKLKAMFPLIVERAEKLQARLIDAAQAGQPIDARDTMARFTTDFIGACGFGLNSDSLNEEDSAFRKLGANIFAPSFRRTCTGVGKEIFPYALRHLKYLGHIEQEVVDLVKFITKQRNYQVSGRNDFIDLMLECKQKGLIVGDSLEKFDKNGVPEQVTLELTDEVIAAQVFVFFAAGFETSSSATSFTLHKLAYNPEVQKKVQADVDRVLAKYNNKLSYEAVKEMKYLEYTFKEGMRMFPSLGFLKRESARKYTIPELNVSIDEGVGVMIPLQALHNDPKYFEEPDVFNPDRFDPENFKEEAKQIYLPFGTGPRACIGERLGLMQSLSGLAAVLSRFTVEPASNTIKEPLISPFSHVVQSIDGGLPLMFRERKEKIV